MPRVSLEEAARAAREAPPEVAYVPSSSDPGIIYKLTRIQGAWVCDPRCPGFSYRGTCRHVREQEGSDDGDDAGA